MAVLFDVDGETELHVTSQRSCARMKEHYKTEYDDQLRHKEEKGVQVVDVMFANKLSVIDMKWKNRL